MSIHSIMMRSVHAHTKHLVHASVARKQRHSHPLSIASEVQLRVTHYLSKSEEWLPSPLRKLSALCSLLGFLSLLAPSPLNMVLAGISYVGAIADMYTLPKSAKFIYSTLKKERLKAFRDARFISVNANLISFIIGTATNGAILLNASSLAKKLWLIASTSGVISGLANLRARLPVIRDSLRERDFRALVRVATAVLSKDPISDVVRGEAV